MKDILQQESLVLREISKDVPLEKITSPEIQKIIKEMKSALLSQDDGVAIAAPQIGYSLRIFVVSGKVKNITKKNKGDDEENDKSKYPDIVFINPTIKKISKERVVLEEGCLSVRYLYGQVSRGVKATVEAYDENGKKFTQGGTGLLAQIFQHEVDHLNGILFIDKAKNIEEITPEEVRTRK